MLDKRLLFLINIIGIKNESTYKSIMSKENLLTENNLHNIKYKNRIKKTKQINKVNTRSNKNLNLLDGSNIHILEKKIPNIKKRNPIKEFFAFKFLKDHLDEITDDRYLECNAVSLSEINENSGIHFIYALVKNNEIKKIINLLKNKENGVVNLDYFKSATSICNDNDYRIPSFQDNNYAKACELNDKNIDEIYDFIKKKIPNESLRLNILRALINDTYLDNLPLNTFVDNKINEHDDLFLLNINFAFHDLPNLLKKKLKKFFVKNKLNDFNKLEKIIKEENYVEWSEINKNNNTSINIKHENNNLIIYYEKSELLTLNNVYEILLCNNLIENENDFLKLIKTGNKKNNKLHFRNIYNKYYKVDNLEDEFPTNKKTPYSIVFGYKKIFDTNNNLINEEKYIKDLNLSQLKIDITNNQLDEATIHPYRNFYNSAKIHYEFLNKLSKATEVFFRK